MTEPQPPYYYPREPGTASAAESQILTDLRALTMALGKIGERLAVLETLLRDQARDHEDHEARLRTLERSSESYATADAVEQLRRDADTHVTRADLRDQQGDRTRKVWLAWSAIALFVVPAWTLILNLVFEGRP